MRIESLADWHASGSRAACETSAMKLVEHVARDCEEMTIRVDLLRTRLLAHLLAPCKDAGWEEERAAHLARLFEAEAELLHKEAQQKLRAAEESRSTRENVRGRTAGMIATVQASHGLS
jgi:hypothetical protein